MKIIPKGHDLKRTLVMGLVLISLFALCSSVTEMVQASPRKVFIEAWVQIEQRYIEPQSSVNLVTNAIKGMVRDYKDTISEETTRALYPTDEKEMNLKTGLDSIDRSMRLLRERLGENFDQTKHYRDAIDGMVSGLILDGTRDYYSQYMRPETNKEFREQLDNQYEGVGIRIEFKKDELIVVQPIEGSPAYRAGIEPGDRIVEVDGKTLEEIPIRNVEEAAMSIKGKLGSTVVLGVARPGVSEILHFSLTRERVRDDGNVRKEILPGTDGVGYIAVRTFSIDVTEDFQKAIEYLQSFGCRKLVLDLRMNPGGLLDQAISFCELVLPRESLITYTQGRDPKDYNEYLCKRKPIYTDSLAVLVNEYSASAAEIVAGAIKDDKRGTLVGKRTFGKGSVQEIIELRDNTSLKLTIAKYHTPSGVCIHGTGIEPDVAVEAARRSKEAEPEPTNVENNTPSPPIWQRDLQLREAVRLLESGEKQP